MKHKAFHLVSIGEGELSVLSFILQQGVSCKPTPVPSSTPLRVRGGLFEVIHCKPDLTQLDPHRSVMTTGIIFKPQNEKRIQMKHVSKKNCTAIAQPCVK